MSTNTAAEVDLKTTRRTLENFSYEPLDTSRRSFRLIEVLPFTEGREVECRIQHALLPNTESSDSGYYALSYAWGDQSASTKRTISLNGKMFSVGYNLYQFLVFAAKTLEDVRQNLWIDAICINQEDISERNHQVQQMGNIYRGAQTVFVWLGLEAETQLKEQRVRIFLRHLLKEFGFRDLDCVDTQLMELARAPYWTRVWIVQELALARKVRIIYGSRYISWKTISACLARKHFIARDDDEFNYRQNPAAKLAVRFEMLFEEARYRDKKATTFAGTHQLSEYMLQFKDNQCSDPRDKVFAFLGLASDSSNFSVDYDYSICQLLFLVIQRALGLNLPDIIALQRTLGITISQLREQFERDMNLAKDYVSDWIEVPARISEFSTIVNIENAVVTWRQSPFLDAQVPPSTAGDNDPLKPGDLICKFIFEPFSDEKSRRKQLKSPLSDFAIILREDSETYQYVAFCEIVDGPRIYHSTVLQSKNYVTEYRLFHFPSSLRSSHLGLYSIDNARTLDGILMTPRVILALLEIAEYRGKVGNTINVYGEPGD